MKPRRRRRRRACFAAVDGVVAVVVAQLFRDVRRQRHLTYAVEDIEEIALNRKADAPVSAVENFQHLGA